MKVIILTDEPFPNGMASTNRIKSYAKAIRGEECDVEVVICRKTECFGIRPRNTQGTGKFDHINYHYIGGTPLRGSNVVIRFIGDILDSYRTERYIRHNLNKGDVLLLYMNNNVKKELRFVNAAHSVDAYCVRELCELPYGTGKETSQTIKLRKKTLEELFPLLDGVISISSSLMQIAITYCSTHCKHIKIPILVDFNRIRITPNKSSENPYVFHAGTLNEQKDGILGMIESFGMALQKSNIPAKFLITGNIEDSSHENEIRNLLNLYHLEDKIIFLGYITDEELNNYLNNATMVIINKYPTQQNEYCFSTKLGEYMAAAIPVITTNIGEAMNWLDNGKDAIIVKSKDNEELSDAIAYVLTHPIESRQIGICGREKCRLSFSYSNWGRPLVNFFKSLNAN